MFLCDVICLLVATFGYSAFGVDTGSGNVISDIQNSRIPIAFVLLILALTVLMVGGSGDVTCKVCSTQITIFADHRSRDLFAQDGQLQARLPVPARLLCARVDILPASWHN